MLKQRHEPGPPMTLGNMRSGIVAKRRDSRYRSGRCRDWIKIKNIAHPAIERAMLIALSKRGSRRD
jgi:ATP-dependent DNA ligase